MTLNWSCDAHLWDPLWSNKWTKRICSRMFNWHKTKSTVSLRDLLSSKSGGGALNTTHVLKILFVAAVEQEEKGIVSKCSSQCKSSPTNRRTLSFSAIKEFSEIWSWIWMANPRRTSSKRSSNCTRKLMFNSSMTKMRSLMSAMLSAFWKFNLIDLEIGVDVK